MEQPSEHPFDRSFREKMEGAERRPSELPWIGISASLDEMRKKRRRKGWMVLSLAALLIALLFLYKPVSYLSTSDENQWIKAFMELPAWEGPSLQDIAESENGNKKHEAPAIANPEWKAGDPTIQSGAGVNQEIVSTPIAKKPNLFNAPNTVAKKEKTPPNNLTSPGPGMPGFLAFINASTIPVKEQMSIERKSFLLPDGSYDPLSFRLFRIGFIAVAQSTSLSSSGIDNYRADATGRKRMKVRAAYGLSTAFDFSRSIGMEINLLISSSEGQSFQANGGHSDLRSNYIRVPVMLKYRFLRAGTPRGLPEALCMKAGLEYGRLNWVNMDEFSNFIKPSQFNPTEFRVVADISYEKYLSPQHILTGGLRAMMPFPGQAVNEQVRSGALAFYLQLHYGFTKRNH